MINSLSPESKVLLNLLANSLFSKEIEIKLNDIDLEKLFSESVSQTVAALAFDALPSNAAEYDALVFNKWQNYSFSVIQKNISQMYSNFKLEILFTENKLPFCTIKGFASAFYYNKRYLRQMGDIDFIVPCSNIETCKNLLLKNGFKVIDKTENHDFHIGFKKNNELYEMHKDLTSFFDDEGLIKKYTEEIFSNIYSADFGDVKITIPGKFAHGLSMLLHMHRHMLDGGGIGLRHLCDWATFVNSIEDSEWEIIFKEKLKKINLWKFARVLSKVSSTYLGISQKEWFSEISDDIAERMLVDIINGGNFGRKDIKRYQELLFISRGTKKTNKCKLLYNGYLRKVYSWSPVLKRHKVLLPIGMIVYPFRIAFLVIFKHKNINLSQNYKSGNQRNNLYEEIFR